MAAGDALLVLLHRNGGSVEIAPAFTESAAPALSLVTATAALTAYLLSAACGLAGAARRVTTGLATLIVAATLLVQLHRARHEQFFVRPVEFRPPPAALHSMASFLRAAAPLVGIDPSESGVELRDAHGRPVTNVTQLTPRGEYFVLREGELWVWPALRIGDEIELGRPDPRLGLEGDAVSQNLSLRVLSSAPRVFLIRDFLSDDECSRIIESSQRTMLAAQVELAGGESALDTASRTGRTGVPEEGSIEDIVNRRARHVARYHYGEFASEHVQCIHYAAGQRYKFHYDPWGDDEMADRRALGIDSGVNRFITLLFYLNDVEAGGETAFPLAVGFGGYDGDEENCQQGLVVKPQKRAAIMWYNLEASAVAQGQYGADAAAAAAAAAGASLNEKGSAPDHYALHAGCPPSKGEKWAANKWVLNMPDKQYVTSGDRWTVPESAQSLLHNADVLDDATVLARVRSRVGEL